HPNGTQAGAIAIRQAVNAIIEGSTLEEKADTNSELKYALEKWGYKKK
ncbi:MAG: ribulose-bisphosphate carboxylase large subunit, partial [Candidatus Lokiarchaeota archaeon]|nr:ribulose-bisphosphate carboxylase large subunit [Candidatus Lokiarchaeota archaeon]